MSKKRKHYRRISPNINTSGQTETMTIGASSLSHETSATNSLSTYNLKQDLIRTSALTLGLVLVVIIASVTNQHTNWALELGNYLYRILHIR